MGYEIYIPLIDLVDITKLPLGGISSEALKDVYLASPSLDIETGETVYKLLLLSDVKLRVPGIDFIELALSPGSGTLIEGRLKFTPLRLVLRLEMRLLIDANVLRPVGKSTNSTWKPDLDAKTLDIILGIVELTIKGDGEINLELLTSTPLIPPCMVGTTGIVLEIGKLQWISQSSSSLPLGISSGSTGLYLDDVTVDIPQLPISKLRMDNVFLGTGGFAGKVAGQWTPQLSQDKKFTGNCAGTLFDIPVALKEIDLEFKQNVLVKSKIQGAMIFPFFDQPAIVDIGLTMDGDFTIALSADQVALQSLLPPDELPQKNAEGLFVFSKKDLMKLTVKGLGFEHQDGKFLINMSGSIKPLIRNLDWPEFDVKSLSIDSEGKVKIDGGWINLPNQKSFNFYGFSANFTKIGFGNEEDGSRWIGLSGGIKLVDGLPLEGGVEGLRIIWKSPTDVRLDIGGIRAGFEIKDVLKFNGTIIFIDEPNKKGFKGGVKMVLYPLNGCSLDVQLMVGKNTLNPPYTFFYIYMGVELPIGIPLFSTGLSLYGMAGLFGYNIEPSKGKGSNPPNETWYENPDGTPGWYLRNTPGITDAGSKWIDNYESMAFGAGVTLGTAPDNGFNFSAKTLIVFLIPGPIIIVEGKANFLKERKNLDDNPLFRVLAVFDNRVGIFLMNIEANYMLPEKGAKREGKVLKIHGLAEAFFDFNRPTNWHLYIGQDQPEAKRIRAEILSLFEANAYFMLNNNSLAMGAWVGYEAQWDFNPLYVSLEAWMEGKADISFKPRQAKGSLALQGNVKLKAFAFSIGLSVGADVTVQTPNPFYVHAGFEVKLDLPWPLPDPEAHIELEWKEETPPPIPMPLAKFGIEHLKVTEKWSLEKYPGYDADGDGFRDDNQVGEPANALQNSPIIPLDARPVIVFAKPVEDVARIGDDASPATEEMVGDYSFKYRLKKILLEKMAKNGQGSWTVVASKEEVGGSVGEIYGKWQAVPDGDQQVNAKLMLWGSTSFDISRELENNEIWYDHIQGNYNPCNIDIDEKVICIDFEDKKQEELPSVFVEDGIIFYGFYGGQTAPGVFFKLLNYNAPWAGTTRALELTGTTATPSVYLESHFTSRTSGIGSVLIVFPERIGEVNIFFGKGSRLKVTVINEDIRSMESKDVDIPLSTPDADMMPVILKGDFRAVLLDGKALVSKICYVTSKEIKRVADNELLLGHIKTTTEEHWNNHKAHIFEPDMYYKLTAVTEAIRNGESFEFFEHAYFQTENPPGVYASGSGNGEQYPTGGPLKDLSVYISRTIPNAGDKPVYRAYDVGLIFNEPNVEQMYLMATLPLRIQLFDNNDVPVLDGNGKEAIFDNQWGDNPQIFLTREEDQWISVMDQGCVTIDSTKKQKTKNLYVSLRELILKPETLYKAKMFAGSGQGRHVVYQFSFITSKYSTFTHQIHSFQDIAWSHGRLQGLSGPLLAPTDKTKLEGILSTINQGNSYQPDVEHKKFEQITELFKLGVRQLPNNLEVLALDDGSKCYGFLLESPEPVDWKRTTISALYSSGSFTINENTEPIKIIGASISRSGPGYNSEYVDILLKESFDISGLVVEHKHEGGGDFQAYFSFGTERVFPSGTLIRIHTGEKDDDTNASPEIEHRYLSLNTWQFNSQGETIRLKDARGNILHAKYIAKNGIFSNKGMICIRNADNIRAFVFFPAGTEKAGNVNAGNYRFGFVFKRNIGDVHPVLKRMGRDDSEEASMEFLYPAILP